MSDALRFPITRLETLAPKKRNSMVGGPFGSNLVSRDYVSEGVPVIRGANLTDSKYVSHDGFVYVTERKADELRTNNAQPGDIVFTQRGTLGQVGIIPSDKNFTRYVISQSQMKMTVDSTKASVDYLYYYFRMPSMISYIENHALQAGVPHINLGILKKFEVVLPPLPIQRKIAAVLAAYDDLVENNKRRIALLEKMAEEIYREWFVRFRFPGYQSTEFEKGIPKGWSQKKFGEFCRLKRGYDLPNEQIDPGPYPVVASTSVKAFHKHFKAESPVITTGRSGSLGEVLITFSRAWPLNTSLYVQRFFGNSPFLVYYTLKSMGLENFNSGAGVPTLNRNHLNGILIAVPDTELQRQFDHAVSPMHEQAELLRKMNAKLGNSRNLLLPRLISGKLSVEDLDIHFPPSMQEAEVAAAS